MRFFAALICSFPMPVLAADFYDLSCEKKTEKNQLKQAPHGAKRIGEHILEVGYSSGLRKFIDKPPYGQFVEGLSWEYCGYNENVKAHLILRREEQSYTGSLLLDESGKVINAGFAVIFSPNKQNFLAIQQEAGSDGQNWTLYEISGNKLWEGFSTIYIPKKTGEADAIEIENPTLSDDLQISAEMICWESRERGGITLKKIGSQWKWLPKLKC